MRSWKLGRVVDDWTTHSSFPAMDRYRDVPLLLRMCQGVEEMELQAGDFLFEEGKPLDKVRGVFGPSPASTHHSYSN